MLNIIRLQGNAKQNYNVIPLHTHREAVERTEPSDIASGNIK